MKYYAERYSAENQKVEMLLIGIKNAYKFVQKIIYTE